MSLKNYLNERMSQNIRFLNRMLFNTYIILIELIFQGLVLTIKHLKKLTIKKLQVNQLNNLEL